MKEYIKKSTAKNLRSENRKLWNALRWTTIALQEIKDYNWSDENVNAIKHIARSGFDGAIRYSPGNKLADFILAARSSVREGASGASKGGE